MSMIQMNRVPQVRMTSPLFTGLFYSLIFFMAAGTLIVSLLMYLTSLQENSLVAYTMVIHGVSLFAGGLAGGKKNR